VCLGEYFISLSTLYPIISRGDNAFDFKPFYSQYKLYYPDKKQPTPKFLQWFIGFTEGDGSKKNRKTFFCYYSI